MLHHRTVLSLGALLSRHLLWHRGKRLHQLHHRNQSTRNWLFFLRAVWLRHVSIELWCNKLFELCRWNLLVIGCELVFELRGRDL